MLADRDRYRPVRRSVDYRILDEIAQRDGKRVDVDGSGNGGFG
jgi:hypothetical protein